MKTGFGPVFFCAPSGEEGAIEEVEIVAEIDGAVVGVVAEDPGAGVLGEAVDEKVEVVAGIDDTVEVAVAIAGVGNEQRGGVERLSLETAQAQVRGVGV